jgi:hypothetical protein
MHIYLSLFFVVFLDTGSNSKDQFVVSFRHGSGYWWVWAIGIGNNFGVMRMLLYTLMPGSFFFSPLLFIFPFFDYQQYRRDPETEEGLTTMDGNDNSPRDGDGLQSLARGDEGIFLTTFSDHVWSQRPRLWAKSIRYLREKAATEMIPSYGLRDCFPVFPCWRQDVLTPASVLLVPEVNPRTVLQGDKQGKQSIWYFRTEARC